MSRRAARLPVLDYEPRAPHPLRVEVQRFDRRHAMRAEGPHAHSFYMLLFLERGGGVHRVGARARPARAGDLFVVAPGEVHDARRLGGAGALLLFAPDALEPGRDGADVFARPGELLLLAFAAREGRLRVPPRDRPRWRRRLAELAEELAVRRAGDVEAARALLRLILVDAMRLAEAQLGAVAVAARPLLAQVFAFIEERYRQPISLADVARAVGRSRAHLTTVVARETGRPVLAWILERRLAEARRRLVQTDEAVEEIAAAVSYEDASYFIRQFRRAHGMTPLAWRRAMR